MAVSAKAAFKPHADRVRVFSPTGTGSPRIEYSSPAVRAAKKAEMRAAQNLNRAPVANTSKLGG